MQVPSTHKRAATNKEVRAILCSTSDTILKQIKAFPITITNKTSATQISKFTNHSSRNICAHSNKWSSLTTLKKISNLPQSTPKLLKHTQSNFQRNGFNEKQVEEYLNGIQEKIDTYKAQSYQLFGQPCKTSQYDASHVKLISNIKAKDLNSIEKSIEKYNKRISTANKNYRDEYNLFLSHRSHRKPPLKEEMMKAFSQNTIATLSGCYRDILREKNVAAKDKLQGFIASEYGGYVKVDTQKIGEEVDKELARQNIYSRVRIKDSRLKRKK